MSVQVNPAEVQNSGQPKLIAPPASNSHNEKFSARLKMLLFQLFFLNFVCLKLRNLKFRKLGGVFNASTHGP
jgi:hypothetical protein